MVASRRLSLPHVINIHVSEGISQHTATFTPLTTVVSHIPQNTKPLRRIIPRTPTRETNYSNPTQCFRYFLHVLLPGHSLTTTHFFQCLSGRENNALLGRRWSGIRSTCPSHLCLCCVKARDKDLLLFPRTRFLISSLFIF